MVTFVQCYCYNRPFDGSHNVEVALSENEFDTPALRHSEKEKNAKVLHGRYGKTFACADIESGKNKYNMKI